MSACTACEGLSTALAAEKARADRAEAEREQTLKDYAAQLADSCCPACGKRREEFGAEPSRLSLLAERDALRAQVASLRAALDACRSFLVDPEGFAGVTISDTVWVRDGMTLLDWVEGAIIHADATTPGETAPRLSDMKPEALWKHWEGGPDSPIGAARPTTPAREAEHWGRSVAHGGLEKHRGAKAACPAPDCGPPAAEPVEREGEE